MNLCDFRYEANISSNLDARARAMDARIRLYEKKIDRDHLYASNQRMSYTSFMKVLWDNIDGDD